MDGVIFDIEKFKLKKKKRERENWSTVRWEGKRPTPNIKVVYTERKHVEPKH